MCLDMQCCVVSDSESLPLDLIFIVVVYITLLSLAT